MDLFRIGRTSLLIGLTVLVLAFVTGELISGSGDSALLGAIGSTLEIGGWVAMWRPLEIFLYEWWPIAEDGRLLARLAEMPIQIAPRSGR